MRRKLVILLALVMVTGTTAAAQAGWRGGGGYPEGDYPERGVYPAPRHAPHGAPYVILQGGVFDPNDSEEGLRGYDEGWSFDFGLGSRLSPVLAVEGLVGAYGAENGPNQLEVVPVTLGGRFILPGSFIEPYLGAGLGFNFARLQEEAVGDFSGIDDSNASVGGYMSLGADAWIGPRGSLSLEAKYRMGNPSFTTNAGNSLDVDISGLTVNVGMRFEF